MGIGDWGLGIGDWGLGPIPNPQSPIPNPQSPIPNPHVTNDFFNFLGIINFIKKKIIFLMGNILESCGSADTCCKNHSRQVSQPISVSVNTKENSSSEASGESASELENEEKVPLPNNILNMPVRTNSLVIKRSMNPLDFYEELETVGSGAFGLVKKVCLRSNPDTIRAMKIISKKYLLKGINDDNLSEEI
jgi:hypothetical protein